MPRTRIAFVGQCHTSFYPGVSPEHCFPQIVRREIESSRPGMICDIIVEQYYHPWQLRQAVSNALRTRPRTIILEVTGLVAARGREPLDLDRLPASLRTARQRMNHFRHAAQTVLLRMPLGSGLVAYIDRQAWDRFADALGPLLPRYPRPTIAEYRSAIEEALARMVEARAFNVIVEGPVAPNLDVDHGRRAGDVAAQYRAVQQMASAVAAEFGVPFVERWDVPASRYFQPGTTHPSAKGHAALGHLLAQQLLLEDVV